MPVAVTDRVALAPLVRDRAGKVVPFGDVAAMAGALELILTEPGWLASTAPQGGRSSMIASSWLTT